MGYRIAHISDIHFGKIGNPEIVDVLVEEVNDAEVDLVCLSGDLTQRARHEEFRLAARMIESIGANVLVVPGNHDVYAWWYPFRRLGDSLRRYRHYITDDLAPSVVQNGVAVLGINSAYGWTIKGGHIDNEARERMRDFFLAAGESAFKIVVVHHHLSRIEALGVHDVARNAQLTLDAAVDANVDLVLCGHLHISHIEPVEIIPGEHRLVVASAGTATSTRGRKAHRRSNFYNIIDVGDEQFTIEELRFDPYSNRFQQDCETRFERVLSAYSTPVGKSSDESVA